MVSATNNDLRKLQEKMAHIKEYSDSNSNSKMTLLDQRAEIEKKKQNAENVLDSTKKELDRCRRRCYFK